MTVIAVLLLAADLPAATFTLDPLVVALIAGALIPIVTGMITKLRASDGLKAGVALVLSLVVAVLAVLATGTPFTVRELAEAAVAAFIANISSYQGVWKPIGRDDRVPGEGLFPDKGLGTPVNPPEG